VLSEARDPIARAGVLGPYVEIVLESGDITAARVAADELTTIAAEMRAPFLRALAERAVGAVLLAEGDVRAALVVLRGAWIRWREIDAPYEAARVRILISLACRSFGDDDSAEMELDAAGSVFVQLGAAADVAHVEQVRGMASAKGTSGLTAREVQVLRLVATGKTNRAIADELFISEKTVARHVSNIFTKLGLSSRSAATAFAYEHELV
jgi:DNA-binding CsgD family transcriptional regulator